MLPAAPEDGDAGFTIGTTTEKAAEFGNGAHGLVQGRWFVRQLFGTVGGDIQGFPLSVRQSDGAGQVGLQACQVCQPEQPPGDKVGDGEQALQGVDGSQAMALDVAPALEHVVEALDEPTHAVVLDQQAGFGKTCQWTGGQQAPVDGRQSFFCFFWLRLSFALAPLALAAVLTHVLTHVLTDVLTCRVPIR